MNQALHNAIVDVLTAGLASPLPAIPVYSGQPPQDQPMPYVLVGEASGDAWNTSTSKGARVSLEATIVSSYKGAKEALAIADRVMTLLGHGETVNLAGAATLVDLWCSPPSTDTLDDGRTTRAPVRITALVDDIAPTTP